MLYMDEEVHTALTRMGERIESLEGLVRTSRRDILEKLEEIQNTMVTKKHLDERLAPLEADVATKESVRSLVPAEESKGGHGGNG